MWKNHCFHFESAVYCTDIMGVNNYICKIIKSKNTILNLTYIKPLVGCKFTGLHCSHAVMDVELWVQVGWVLPRGFSMDLEKGKGKDKETLRKIHQQGSVIHFLNMFIIEDFFVFCDEAPTSNVQSILKLLDLILNQYILLFTM